MMRKDNIIRWIKREWIAVSLLIATTLFVGVFTTAEYERDTNKMKRVVATGSQIGQLFASDLLESEKTGSIPIINCYSKLN